MSMNNIDQFADRVSRGIALRIRRVREAQGLSQQEVADALTAQGHKFSRLMVTHTEAAKRPITVVDLAALAVVFRVPVTHFFQDSSDAGSSALNDLWLSEQSHDVFLEELQDKIVKERADIAASLQALNARRAALGA